jgi:S-layer homology domain
MPDIEAQQLPAFSKRIFPLVFVLLLLAGTGVLAAWTLSASAHNAPVPSDSASGRGQGSVQLNATPEGGAQYALIRPSGGDSSPDAPWSTCLTQAGTITTTDPTIQRPNTVAQGGSCSTSSTGAGVHYDVYAYTLSTSSVITASLCAGGGGSANFDTFVAIYQGAGGAPIASFAPDGCNNLVASNDDSCGSASQVQATLSAGTFYVVVTQYSTTTGSCTGGLCYGSYTLSVGSASSCANVATMTPTAASTPTATPVFNTCLTQAGSITVSDPTFQRPNTTAQGGTCSTSSVGAGVHYDVYSYTVFQATSIRASLCPAGGGSANFDTFVAIYQGAGGAPIASFAPNGCSNLVASNDDLCGSASQVQATVAAGTFYVVVTQYSPDTGLCTGGLCYGDYSLAVSSGGVCVNQTPTSTPIRTSTPTAIRTATNIATATNTATAAATNTAPNAATGTATITPNVPASATRTRTSTPVQAGSTSSPIATSTAVTNCAIEYTDVPPTNTFYANVRCLACRGILSGYSDPARCPETGAPCFRPGDSITRGQMAKIVSNAAGFSEPHTEVTFTDVPVTHTFYIFIQRLASRNIVAGYSDSIHCASTGAPCYLPDAHVTRGQMSKFVAIAAGFVDPTPAGQQTYTDVHNTDPFWQYIEQLSRRGVVGGYTCGSPGEPCDNLKRPYFRPGALVTRGQASKFVSLAFFPNCQTHSDEQQPVKDR